MGHIKTHSYKVRAVQVALRRTDGIPQPTRRLNTGRCRAYRPCPCSLPYVI